MVPLIDHSRITDYSLDRHHLGPYQTVVCYVRTSLAISAGWWSSATPLDRGLVRNCLPLIPLSRSPDLCVFNDLLLLPHLDFAWKMHSSEQFHQLTWLEAIWRSYQCRVSIANVTNSSRMAVRILAFAVLAWNHCAAESNLVGFVHNFREYSCNPSLSDSKFPYSSSKTNSADFGDGCDGFRRQCSRSEYSRTLQEN